MGMYGANLSCVPQDQTKHQREAFIANLAQSREGMAIDFYGFDWQATKGGLIEFDFYGSLSILKV